MGSSRSRDISLGPLAIVQSRDDAAWARVPLVEWLMPRQIEGSRVNRRLKRHQNFNPEQIEK